MQRSRVSSISSGALILTSQGGHGKRKIKKGEDLYMADVLEVTDENFEKEILQSDIPAMVDFWATWCGPCYIVAPIVEELAREYAGKVKIAKMDVDQNRYTPSRYGIRSIPTLILFKNGKVVQTIIGAHPRSIIEEEIKKLI